MYCRYRSTLGYVVLTAELIFIFVYLCQLHFNIMSVVKLQKKYFTQIWNILDCMYMIFSLAYIVIYLYRFEVSSFSLCFCVKMSFYSKVVFSFVLILHSNCNILLYYR